MAAFFRQDNRELLAAIAAAYVRVAEEGAEQISNRLLHHVSRVMTENVVESLEMVKVEEKNGQRLLFAGSDLQFSFKRFFEKASIEQLC